MVSSVSVGFRAAFESEAAESETISCHSARSVTHGRDAESRWSTQRAPGTAGCPLVLPNGCGDPLATLSPEASSPPYPPLPHSSPTPTPLSPTQIHPSNSRAPFICSSACGSTAL